MLPGMIDVCENTSFRHTSRVLLVNANVTHFSRPRDIFFVHRYVASSRRRFLEVPGP